MKRDNDKEHICYLDVKVIPSSKRFDIEMNESNKLKVYLRSAPIKGKANEELLKNLRNIFKCKVEIVRGFTSNKKTLKIEKSCDEIVRLLSRKGNI